MHLQVVIDDEMMEMIDELQEKATEDCPEFEDHDEWMEWLTAHLSNCIVDLHKDRCGK